MRWRKSAAPPLRSALPRTARPSPFSRTYPTRRLRQAPANRRTGLHACRAAAEAGLAPSTLVATVPGFVDRDFDTVLHAANVPELNGLQLASELKPGAGAAGTSLSATWCSNCLARVLPVRCAVGARSWRSISALALAPLIWANTASSEAADGRWRSVTCQCCRSWMNTRCCQKDRELRCGSEAR